MTEALRGLRRDPGFVLVAVLALSLGIGANTALFSVVDAVLFRPLPYPESERLVVAYETHRAKSLTRERPSPGNFLLWRERSRSLQGLVAWYAGTATLRDPSGPQALRSAKVSPDFFRVLGVAPVLGTGFSDDLGGAVYSVADQLRAGDREAMLSHGAWLRRFGSDAAIAGKELSIDGAPFRVVGVLPPDFAMPDAETELYLAWDIPASYRPNAGPGPRFLDGPPRDYRFLNVIGRLRGDVALDAAQAELDQIAAALAVAYPKEDAGWGVRLHPLKEEIVGPTRGPLLALLGAVGVVLLIACANVASLQLARSAARSRHIAVRTALGASPRHIAAMLLAESLILSSVGAGLGLLVAWRGVPALLSLLPNGLPRLAEIGMDPRVFLFTTVLAVSSAVLFGLVPALQAARVDLVPSLGDGGRGPATSAGRQGLRKLLVTTEVAAALVLLVGAALFARSFVRLRAVDPGFEPRHVLAFRIALDSGGYRTAGRSAEFYRALIPRLRGLPGVRSAAAVTYLPLQDRGFDRRYFREGEPDPGTSALETDILMATPGYFETIGMKLLRGRDFSDDDRRETPRVIVVNQTLARQTWPNDDPLGKRLMIDYQGGVYPYEVVGLVNDTRHMGLKDAPRREVFIPHGQNPYLAMNVVVRASADPALLTKAVAREVTALDPAQPVERVRSMDDVVAAASAADRFAAALLVALALVAAALAATGVYGLLSYLVARRSHELGVRLALGAERRDLLRLVLVESGRLVVRGTVVGLLLSLALARLVSALLFEVSAYDTPTFVMVPLAMALIGLAASYVPARRAMQVDPIIALRAE